MNLRLIASNDRPARVPGTTRLARMETLTPQLGKVIRHLLATGFLTPRIATMDLKVTSYTKRVSEAADLGMEIERSWQVSVIDGQRYTQYSIEQGRYRILDGWLCDTQPENAPVQLELALAA